jgi:hypothetical protein
LRAARARRSEDQCRRREVDPAAHVVGSPSPRIKRPASACGCGIAETYYSAREATGSRAKICPSVRTEPRPGTRNACSVDGGGGPTDTARSVRRRPRWSAYRRQRVRLSNTGTTTPQGLEVLRRLAGASYVAAERSSMLALTRASTGFPARRGGGVARDSKFTALSSPAAPRRLRLEQL